jgi:cytidylate kinase
MAVVTITGTTASGAREVGQRVAYLLGVDFVDQQLMVQAAQRCGVPVGVVAQRDERSATMKQRISSAINTLLERSGSSGADSLTGATGLESILSQTYADMAATEKQTPISDRLYAETMETIIRDLAAGGQIVILGRGSQMILRDVPRALHALCIAPAEVRYQRLAERDEIGLEEARRRAVETDQARDAFYRKFWKTDVEDPRLYDVTVETARLGFEAAAEVVASAARLRVAVA